jgi:predicted AlkP superfamily phosphohydrolase/phosphomutase
MAARVLALGIDAADPELVEAFARAGTMPNLAALAGRGLQARTRSVDGFFIGATWPSLSTGVSPGRHGLHYLVQLRPGTYAYYRPETGALEPYPPFWTWLSRAGRRIAVLDVPLTRADPSINGMQIVEWGSHDAVHGFHTWPLSLEHDIRARFGEHPALSPCDAINRTTKGYTAFVNALMRGVQCKTDLTRHYLQQEEWDLFLQVFTEAHCAGHQCWHLHDAAHPGHDATIARATGDPLKRVYTAIDHGIGDIINDAGDATIIVFAAHGMRHWFGAQFLLREVLIALGVTQPEIRQEAPGLRSAVHIAARTAWQALPGGLRKALRPLRERLRGDDAISTLPGLGVDVLRSACFPVHNGLAVGGIRLNLRGREPDGVLDADAAGTFCDDLRSALLEVIDERTGAPAVKRVLKTADLYDGERVDHLPDLLVEWNDDSATGSTNVSGGAGAHVRLRSPRIGTVEGSNDYGRTGEHRPDGFLIAAGPGIRTQRLERTVSILDLAPTLAALLGVTLPQCDGSPVNELSAGTS